MNGSRVFENTKTVVAKITREDDVDRIFDLHGMIHTEFVPPGQTLTRTSTNVCSTNC